MTMHFNVNVVVTSAQATAQATTAPVDYIKYNNVNDLLPFGAFEILLEKNVVSNIALFQFVICIVSVSSWSMWTAKPSFSIINCQLNVYIQYNILLYMC